MNIICKRLILPVLVASVLSTLISKAQDGRNQMLMDMAIPLMDGLQENTEEGMLFDSPDGRIISAQASGVVGQKAAFDYYRVVLPSLGWQIDQDYQTGMSCEGEPDYCLSAVRGEETLLVNVANNEKLSVVTYSLSPK